MVTGKFNKRLDIGVGKIKIKQDLDGTLKYKSETNT